MGSMAAACSELELMEARVLVAEDRLRRAYEIVPELREVLEGRCVDGTDVKMNECWECRIGSQVNCSVYYSAQALRLMADAAHDRPEASE